MVPPGEERDPFQAALAAVRLHDHLAGRNMAERYAVDGAALHDEWEPPSDESVGELPEHLRWERIAAAESHGATLLFRSARGGSDPDRQRPLFVGLMEVVEYIADLSRTDVQLEHAVSGCRGAVRISETLAKRFPQESAHRSMGVEAACRLADLHYLRGADKDAQKWYFRAFKRAEKIAERWLDTESLMQTGHSVRRLAELAAEDPSAGRATVTMLENAVQWGSLAADRDPGHQEAGLDVSLSDWLLGTADPSSTTESAERIISRLDGNAAAPAARAALAWARSTIG